MKSFLYAFATGLLLTATLTVQAQTAGSYLFNVSTAAEEIRTEVAANGAALKSLVVDYFIVGNPSPDVDGYVLATSTRQSLIETLHDDVVAAIGQATALDSYINPVNIQTWAAQIEGLGDEIIAESTNLRNQILAGDATLANATALAIRADLASQYDLARRITREATYYQQAQVAYDVRILLVDNAGNPVTGSTGLMGYYAYNEYTGAYVYPDYFNANEFSDIRGGTWTFGSYPGYFDGASSRRVTLRPALAGPDGFIPVELVYWSE